MVKKTKTILIAEDDRTTRTVMKKVLENDGYNVIEGDRGEKSLFLALEKDIDAFLIDINMPGLSGIEICERIRSIERYKFTPIICITSMEEESNLEEVFASGATDFISKPANPIILKARLKAHLLKVKHFNEMEQSRRYTNRYISSKTQRIVEAYSLTGLLPAPERHTVCVMFTDVRGFTSLSQHIGLEILFEGLSKNLGMQVDAVYGHSGYIDKFAGDGLMAIFEGEEMVANACRCALNIIDTTKRNQSVGDKSAFPLGIGIHVGEVLIGNIGSAEHFDYSVIGESVNMASRLCSYAEPMHIDVSHEIVQMLNEADLEFDEPKYVSMKGIEQPVGIYHLKWAHESQKKQNYS
ncbi:MAG: response regulator [Gammaproteobacteria bacterium]|nr:response regulator [Gammaproteobacteria bacterium]